MDPRFPLGFWSFKHFPFEFVAPAILRVSDSCPPSFRRIVLRISNFSAFPRPSSRSPLNHLSTCGGLTSVFGAFVSSLLESVKIRVTCPELVEWIRDSFCAFVSSWHNINFP